MIAIATLVLALQAGSAHGLFNEDARVIRAAAETFYRKAEWQMPWWQSGDYVVLDRNYLRKERSSVLDELDQAITQYTSRRDDEKVRAFQSFRKLAMHPNDVYTPSPVLPLEQLRLGASILLTDQNPNTLSPIQTLTLGSGKSVSVRVWGRINPPGYSQDGKRAVLRMYIPSLHGDEAVFFLEEAKSAWKVVLVRPIYYL